MVFVLIYHLNMKKQNRSALTIFRKIPDHNARLIYFLTNCYFILDNLKTFIIILNFLPTGLVTGFSMALYPPKAVGFDHSGRSDDNRMGENCLTMRIVESS